MVDISSQSNKVNITVSSSGVSSNVSASGDASHYYSEKAREWAISNRMVDGVDYSSKYYANKSNQSSLNAQTSEINARNTYTDLQATANQKLEDLSSNTNIALENIGIAEDSALSNIDIAKDSILTEINTTKNNVITEINNTGINTKANTALNNLTDEGKELITIYSLPSENYIDLTIGSTGTSYTAPANGWVYYDARSNGNASSQASINVYDINGNNLYSVANSIAINGHHMTCFLPIRKNQTFKVFYQQVSEQLDFRFIYAQGEI